MNYLDTIHWLYLLIKIHKLALLLTNRHWKRDQIEKFIGHLFTSLRVRNICDTELTQFLMGRWLTLNPDCLLCRFIYDASLPIKEINKNEICRWWFIIMDHTIHEIRFTKYNNLKERDVIILSLSIILISSIIILLFSLNSYRIYLRNNLKNDEKIIFTINNNFQ